MTLDHMIDNAAVASQNVSLLDDLVTREALKLSIGPKLDAAIRALEMFISMGCPVCSGDCSSANPPVNDCPIVIAQNAVRGLL